MSTSTKITNSRGEIVGKLIDSGDEIVAWSHLGERLAIYEKSTDTTWSPERRRMSSGNTIVAYMFPWPHRAQ